MKRPLLIAETPRAGAWNHRFIVPTGSSIGDNNLERYFIAARGKPQSVGSNYIAVSKPVAQLRQDPAGRELGGREGHETLILIGVRTGSKGLSHSQIIDRLKSYLSQLEKLITVSINWDVDGGSMAVQRPELNQWSLEFKDLPVENGWSGETGLLKIIGIVVTIALVGIAGYKLYDHVQSKSMPDPYVELLDRLRMDVKTSFSPETKVSDDELLRKLGKEMDYPGIPDRSFVVSNLTEIYPPPSPLKPTLKAGREFNPYAILERERPPDFDDFKTFVKLKVNNPEEITKLRSNIQKIVSKFFDLWGAKENLEKESANERQEVPKIPKPLWKLSQYPASQNDIKTDDISFTPEMPFFTHRDAKLIQFIKGFLLSDSAVRLMEQKKVGSNLENIGVLATEIEDVARKNKDASLSGLKVNSSTRNSVLGFYEACEELSRAMKDFANQSKFLGVDRRINAVALETSAEVRNVILLSRDH